MITGVHTMFYTSKPDELRAFLRDKLGLRSTDVGQGWLIFDVPEAEMGCHPADAEHGRALGHASHLVLLRRRREDGRRPEEQGRRLHQRHRGSRLRPGDALPDAGRLRGAALPAALSQELRGAETTGGARKPSRAQEFTPDAREENGVTPPHIAIGLN